MKSLPFFPLTAYPSYLIQLDDVYEVVYDFSHPLCFVTLLNLNVVQSVIMMVLIPC